MACNPAISYLEAGYQNSTDSVQVEVSNLSSCDYLSCSTRKGAWLITGTRKRKNVGKCAFVFFYSLGDQLIIHYCDLGYSHNEILAALLGAHGIYMR